MRVQCRAGDPKHGMGTVRVGDVWQMEELSVEVSVEAAGRCVRETG